MSDKYIRLTTDTLAPAPPLFRTADEILCELRRRTSESRRASYAAVALDELTARGCEPSKDATRRASPRSVLTHAALEPLIPPILELAGVSHDKPWCDFVLGLLDLVPVPFRKPSQVLRLARGAPRAARPFLLADYWHLLMAGCRHDPIRILSIALDVWGDALSSPPRLLGETLLAVGRREVPESPWRPSRTAGDPMTPLEVLAAIPGELDFVRGWCLVRLRPLFEDMGLEDRALALARGLSDRFRARADTLRRWASPRRAETREQNGPGENPGTVTAMSLPCDLGCGWRRFEVYVGRPAPGFHPVHFQAARIREEHDAVVCRESLDQVREAAEALS